MPSVVQTVFRFSRCGAGSGNINIREIERYALKNSGYEVEEFESGESLFKRLERAVPSLLLLDIMLPDAAGRL